MDGKQHFSPGLDGVVAAETDISYLDTQYSQILIRGYDLIDLSKTKSYLELVHLLLEGRLPDENETETVKRKVNSASNLPADLVRLLELLPEHTHPMDCLRTGVSALAGYDRQIDDRSPSANKERAYQLLGKMPALTASSYRKINKGKPIPPLQHLSYSANFLYMMTGKIPSALEERIFDRSLILYSEHEMPNSTFTARVIASTQSDLYGALTGAVASLKGNLHGGANEAVMYMLLEAKTKADFEQILLSKLRRKEKIMGFGHRVYMKKMDPRALMMKDALQQLCDQAGDHRLYEMCEAGEQLMEREKGLYPNLDYYAAPVYWMLGIPIPLYTPVFFSARTAGLCAHVIEQHTNNRLFRPRVRYTGPRYENKSNS
ncbi:citrate synthase [Bacillus halotolerans]|uniref:citrate synthase n=1 Tax=Bacillus halotolerans TaxID=260554 RepID=UPI001C3C556A|nr:citrate synthase [Bacillus halotolerans]MBV5122665.1 citrate synthase [Bacillus halotolerans]MCC2116280.1 citrate synthase [Bacillus halotolerans]MDQ7723722.1 citrate synthase [Bacillus halotolerans]MEC0252860.1 citrate synthase [Bacillus halotolerans]MEC0357168.1 citrate synthase [Bacillus halotolerans]